MYGVGATGQNVTRHLAERGVDIVGAIGRVENVGADLGTVAELDRELNVEINDDADDVLENTEADVAIVSIASTLEEMYPHLKRCLEAGVNVITTSEETLYPWYTSPDLAGRLDRIAIENDVTFTGGGYQDIFEVNLPVMLTGASRKLDGVDGTNRYNIDDYGPAVVEYFFGGKDRDDVEEKLERGGAPESLFRTTLEAQIAELGLSEADASQKATPIVADRAVESEALGRTIQEGEVLGLEIDVTIETHEGITFTGTEIAKVYDTEEEDRNEWVIEGTPEMHVVDQPTPVEVGTSTQIVNRLPDIINYESGFVSVTELPRPKYRVGPLETYLD
ncbi:dihydrodipicolinate reductase [Natronobacterium gregoryi SP2]|uniref:Dihydrodipicolinate reductase n=1 Tax=Natronobacterium gregoryi (strain ATCC 43098 / DSM 3393 / CCM 3738 / CIP 104747 / IAM 13177 / JCM 8860 / NBRC 102187 / NCIMB 2189 / SP2) TaxID=797304 RepID=L9XSF2_NATGS|nr:dihydrodipicolinate reductase [Natronobacterium gregoryi SP2]